MARVIGLHVEADRAITATSIVEDEARGRDAGPAHRADVERPEVHAVGAGLEVNRHVLRSDSVHLQLAGPELEAQVRCIGARQHEGEDAARPLSGRRLEGGDALRRIGVEVEEAALEIKVHRTAPGRGDGECALSGLAVEFEFGICEAEPLRREADTRLQLEAAAAAGPQGPQVVTRRRPQPQAELAQVIGLEPQVA